MGSLPAADLPPPVRQLQRRTLTQVRHTQQAEAAAHHKGVRQEPHHALNRASKPQRSCDNRYFYFLITSRTPNYVHAAT